MSKYRQPIRVSASREHLVKIKEEQTRGRGRNTPLHHPTQMPRFKPSSRQSTYSKANQLLKSIDVYNMPRLMKDSILGQ